MIIIRGFAEVNRVGSEDYELTKEEELTLSKIPEKDKEDYIWTQWGRELCHEGINMYFTVEEERISQMLLNKELRNTSTEDWEKISEYTNIPFKFNEASGGHGDHPCSVDVLNNMVFNGWHDGEKTIMELLPSVRDSIQAKIDEYQNILDNINKDSTNEN